MCSTTEGRRKEEKRSLLCPTPATDYCCPAVVLLATVVCYCWITVAMPNTYLVTAMPALIDTGLLDTLCLYMLMIM